MSEEQKLTPMQRQYNEIKTEYQDSILFFRMGDFYEMFNEDAVEASKILGITLTARDKKSDNPTPMCGIPHHSAENYLSKLTKSGKKVAICEQISDPKLPGIVQRKVVRVVTPGTTFSEQILEQKSNNFILSLVEKNNTFGLAFADLSTGDFYATEIEELEHLKKEIFRISPKESLLSRRTFSLEELKPHLENIYFYEYQKDASEKLKAFFGIQSLHNFGLEKKPLAIFASAQLLEYFTETQKTTLNHLTKIQQYNPSEFLPLDDSTIRNLELFYTLRDNKKEGALLHLLDQTKTAMGGRKLKRWLLHPLLDEIQIEERMEVVANLLEDYTTRTKLIETLKEILDLERILARLSCHRGNARDLIALRESLKKTQLIKEIITQTTAPLLQKIQQTL